MRKKIFLILALCWMAVIFRFSGRTAEVSTQDSTTVGRMIGQMLIPGFQDWDPEKQAAFADKVDHPVRKTAHAAEYAVLGFLVAGAYTDRERRRLYGILVPWLVGAAYAVSDEVHQFFVPGRSCQVSDMVLDSSGVLIGVLVGQLLWARKKSKKKLTKQIG